MGSLCFLPWVLCSSNCGSLIPGPVFLVLPTLDYVLFPLGEFNSLIWVNCTSHPRFCAVTTVEVQFLDLGSLHFPPWILCCSQSGSLIPSPGFPLWEFNSHSWVLCCSHSGSLIPSPGFLALPTMGSVLFPQWEFNP